MFFWWYRAEYKCHKRRAIRSKMLSCTDVLKRMLRALVKFQTFLVECRLFADLLMLGTKFFCLLGLGMLSLPPAQLLTLCGKRGKRLSVICSYQNWYC